MAQPTNTSFENCGRWWSLRITAMTPGKLLCLKHVLEANFKDELAVNAPSRPRRPIPRFVMGPLGQPSYVTFTCLSASGLQTMKKALEDYHEAWMKGMDEVRQEQELRKAELAANPPQDGRTVLFRAIPERHMLVDEFLDFLRPLADPGGEDAKDGPHLLLQCLELCTKHRVED